MNHRISVEFFKKGDMRFISHLDLVRLFQRAVRRAGLPVKMTQGFNPHPKISIKRALKLGVESGSEEAFFYVDSFTADLRDFKDRLNRELPEGIKIKDAKTDTG